MTLPAPLRRIAAVARADLIVRVRRPSTVALFLVLCVLAYGMVPAPSSGRTLMTRAGHRALLNSPTIAVTTSLLVALLLGLLGYYLISSTIRRDVVTRVGSVIAAMPVRSWEYLAGKFAGNAAFLGLVTFGYLLNVMVMHLLRGEGPLQPLVYFTTYTLMLAPAILVFSAIALVFECVRPLSGRVGDVLYFFVWIFMMAAAAVGAEDGRAAGWLAMLDVIGLRFMLGQIGGGGPSRDLAIGANQFDPKLSVWVFDGVHWTWGAVATRFAPALLALPLLAMAWLAFHRFDPARVKSSAQRGRRSPVAVLNRALKPASGLLLPIVGAGSGLSRIAVSESWLTFALAPLTLVWALLLAAWSVAVPMATLRATVLPAAFLGIVVAIADIATRDEGTGVRALLYSIPGVKAARVRAQFLSATAIALTFVLVPVLRLALADPSAALSLFIGAAFVAAAAVAAGVLTGGPKTFVGSFLLFFYLVMNGHGIPGFDFAGWNGAATDAVRLGYALAAALLVALAALKERVSLSAA